MPHSVCLMHHRIDLSSLNKICYYPGQCIVKENVLLTKKLRVCACLYCRIYIRQTYMNFVGLCSHGTCKLSEGYIY